MSPKVNRQRIQRRLDQAINLIDTAKAYLIEESQHYETTHPDYFELYCVLVVIAAELSNGVASLRDKI